jgi:arylsulfatase A-like enzyme
MYSMNTSTYPSVHGTHLTIRGNENLPTIAEILHENGYATEAYIANNILRRELGYDKGFDRYIEMEDIEYLSFFRRSTVYKFFKHLRYYGLFGKRRSTDWLTDRVCERLVVSRDKPFFIWAHYMDPHYPFSPPKEYINDIRKDPAFNPGLLSKWNFNESESRIAARLYKAEVRYVDCSIGRVFRVLEKEGLLDNTLIIITSDHGEEFFEHGKFGHGMSHYNEVMAIPMIVRFPDTKPKISSYPVSLIDVMPTILHYTGFNVPSHAKGRNLLELTDIESSEFEFEPVFYDQTRYDLSMKSVHIYPYTLIRTGETEFEYEFIDIRKKRSPNDRVHDPDPVIYDFYVSTLDKWDIENAEDALELGGSESIKITKFREGKLKDLGYF